MKYVLLCKKGFLADHALHIFHSWGNPTIDPVIRFFIGVPVFARKASHLKHVKCTKLNLVKHQTIEAVSSKCCII